VLVRLGEIDLVSLDIHGTVAARLDAEPAASDALDDDADDDTIAGPIAIAVDLSDADTPPESPAPVDNPAP